MQIGMVGLGKMGMNMTLRLLKHKHSMVVFDRDKRIVAEAVEHGAIGVNSLEHMVEKLRPPRPVWLMVPAGKPVEESIETLKSVMGNGDIIIDGGNSHYKDTQRTAKKLEANGIHFVDVGTSGGIWGLELGYCLMSGGKKEICKKLEPIFKSLAMKNGYAYFGTAGAGHFVKMVHNGIEYGMLQAYGEGFELLKASEFNIDLHAAANVWRYGSVIRSWLLDLAESALAKDGDLKTASDYIADSGEGRWTVDEAIEKGVPAPVLAASLFARFRSQEKASFSGKLIAIIRNEFGGHAVKKA